MNRNRFFQNAATAAVAVMLSTFFVATTAEAKPRWQAFVGPQYGNRRPVQADNLKSLREKVQKRSGKFATEYVQNIRSGQWRPAPYKGKPATDKFGNNLLQIR